MTRAECLRGEALGVAFESVSALVDVTIELRRREILGLVGSNGAGKTTLVNALSGHHKPTSGRVRLDGRDVTRLGPERRERRGLVRLVQPVRPSANRSVLENVVLGDLSRGLRRPVPRGEALRLLDRAGLTRWTQYAAGDLPSGAQRRLGIVRALAKQPRYLLLDEPSAGLNQAQSQQLGSFLKRLPQQFGVGLLVVEHDLDLIMRVCERIHVLDHGRTVVEGTPDEIRSDPRWREAYWG
jgi:branched-chain amino acid transport system ATP-binding protein